MDGASWVFFQVAGEDINDRIFCFCVMECIYMYRLDLRFYSHPKELGVESEPMQTAKENSSPLDNLRRVERVMLSQKGQPAQRTTNCTIPAPTIMFVKGHTHSALYFSGQLDIDLDTVPVQFWKYINHSRLLKVGWTVSCFLSSLLLPADIFLR